MQGLVPGSIDSDSFTPPVMISYATATREGVDSEGCGLGMLYAQLIAQKLHSHGIESFSGLHVPAGADWKTYFNKIPTAEVMIVVQTKALYDSEPCNSHGSR